MGLELIPLDPTGGVTPQRPPNRPRFIGLSRGEKLEKLNDEWQSGPSAGIAQVEFLADIAASPSYNSLTELGTKVVTDTGFIPADVSPSAFFFNRGADASSLNSSVGRFRPIQEGGVYTDTTACVPAVQGHEFRHAGLAYILENFTREDVTERWGSDGRLAYDAARYFNEAANETMDIGSESAGTVLGPNTLMSNTTEFEGRFTEEQTAIISTILPRIAGDILLDLGIPKATVNKDTDNE